MRRLLSLAGPTLILITVFIIGSQAAIYFNTKGLISDRVEDLPRVQAVIIPGAAILKDRTLSPVFRDRADAAMKLYFAGKAAKILVSGDNSTVEHNEVNPVRNYLLSKGVPDQDIFLDHAGFDTFSTMYRAHAVFQVESAIVASQSFHLPRSVFLARHLGIATYGYSADVGSHRLLFRNYVREFFAKEKAALDLLVERRPKYLGDLIPITGNGTLYP